MPKTREYCLPVTISATYHGFGITVTLASRTRIKKVAGGINSNYIRHTFDPINLIGLSTTTTDMYAQTAYCFAGSSDTDALGGYFNTRIYFPDGSFYKEITIYFAV